MIGGILWRGRSTWDGAWIASGLPRLLALVTLRRWFRSGSVDTGLPAHLVFCAPGSGNIGDQAMFEAFIERVEGQIIAVVRDASAVHVPPPWASRVELLVLPDLIYGSGARRRRDLRMFASVTRRARSMSIIGADIMDGHYNVRASVNRSVLAEFAAGEGVDSRVLGFSWNGRPKGSARRALARAGESGVRLLARDPHSLKRLEADRICGVEQVSDIVFGATTVAPDQSGPRSTARPLVVVNASALVARKLDLTADYVALVRSLASVADVLLLPHVLRSGDDDLIACRRIHELVDDPRVTLIDRLLTPSQVRTLARRARAVFTGRMHLAIIAMSQGVPAVVLNTQGKVDGLAELVGRSELCMTPQRGFADAAIAMLVRELGADGPIREAIMNSKDRLVELSLVNVSGLTR